MVLCFSVFHCSVYNVVFVFHCSVYGVVFVVYCSVYGVVFVCFCLYMIHLLGDAETRASLVKERLFVLKALESLIRRNCRTIGCSFLILSCGSSGNAVLLLHV